jgi:hypothetical protein
MSDAETPAPPIDPDGRFGKLLSSPRMLFGAVFAVWLVWLLLNVIPWKPLPIGEAGQFGDWFGGINALFTALAFAAVAWSAYMQRAEMRSSQAEMHAQQQVMKNQHAAMLQQRKEMAHQREEMQAAREIALRQSFEATLFRMLEQCRQTHEDLRSLGDKGHRAMERFAKDCAEIVENRKDISDPARLRELIGEDYEITLYNIHESTLGPYFRSLYHLYKLIDRQAYLHDYESRQYANMARAQLSANDLFVLSVNGCSDPGHDFRRLIERFGLLKHLKADNYDHIDILKRCYEPSAFMGREAAELHEFGVTSNGSRITTSVEIEAPGTLTPIGMLLDRISTEQHANSQSARLADVDRKLVLGAIVAPRLSTAAKALNSREFAAEVWSEENGAALRLVVRHSDAEPDESGCVMKWYLSSREPGMIAVDGLPWGRMDALERTEHSRKMITGEFVDVAVASFLDRAFHRTVRPDS